MPFTGETITYSDYSKGWTSFWSYLPDWMIGMNSSFYTWRNGNLYKHNTNATRNRFYFDDVPNQDGGGINYESNITTVFNFDPAAMKMFKTLSLDSTHAWKSELTTDISTGYMESSYFQEKEGTWFAYIRRVDGTIDTKAISTQGIGALGSYSALVLTFTFDIGTGISTGDKVYKVSGGALVLFGEVASHTSKTITLVSTAVTPVAADVIVYVKNSQAESFGARGYYMDCKLTTEETAQVEIFTATSNIFKSNP
jgi:hypothetical protein